MERLHTEPPIPAAEVAAYAGVSTETVHQARRDGELAAYQVGRMWLFDAPQARAWARARIAARAGKAGTMTAPRVRRRS